MPEKPVKIDQKDRKILTIISENSRKPLSEIAKTVSLSRDTVSYRIKRLQKLGIIKYFYSQIDLELLGYNYYHLFLLVNESNPKREEEFLNYLKGHPNTFSLVEYTDRWDFEWIFIARNMKDADTITTEFFWRFSDILIERINLVVLETFSSLLMPYHFHKETLAMPEKITLVRKPDKKDFQILRVLAKDSRLSTYEISRHVGLSPDAVGLRIKKMVKAGIITKFTFHRSLYLLGYTRYTFAVQVSYFDKSHQSKFKEFVRGNHYITRAVKTLGPWDLLIYLFAHDAVEFHKTVKQLKNEFYDVIRHYSTFVRYEEHFFNPLPEAASQLVTTP